jgi:cellulose synthase/poly-beta-1,6-N-acetylglucosamine synthase-like glycosyltransferase
MHVGLAIIYWTLIGLQIILASFLLQPCLLLLIHLLKTSRKSKPDLTTAALASAPATKDYQFGIVITAHQEIAFLPPIVDSLLKQSYSCFNIYIVADDCDTAGLSFDDPRVHLLDTPEPFNSNSRSIHYALEHFEEKDEILVIFDPDNLVHPEFLTVLNRYYNKGYKAVQGNLQAKNMLNTYEKIDSIGVIFNNFIDRECRSSLGYSVNILGCGISVDRNIYQKISYDNLSRMGGFDKHMQFEIARNAPRIAYAEEAILYDEKISDSGNLERQRTRWIMAYFRFLGHAFALAWEGIIRLDFNLFYFGYNLIRPPYFLQIILAILFALVDLVLPLNLYMHWATVVAVFLISLTVIVLIRASDKTVSKGILYMPLFFYHQVRSLFKLKMNKTSILKTTHSKVLYIDDLLEHEPR